MYTAHVGRASKRSKGEKRNGLFSWLSCWWKQTSLVPHSCVTRARSPMPCCTSAEPRPGGPNTLAHTEQTPRCSPCSFLAWLKRSMRKFPCQQGLGSLDFSRFRRLLSCAALQLFLLLLAHRCHMAFLRAKTHLVNTFEGGHHIVLLRRWHRHWACYCLSTGPEPDGRQSATASVLAVCAAPEPEARRSGKARTLRSVSAPKTGDRFFRWRSLSRQSPQESESDSAMAGRANTWLVTDGCRSGHEWSCVYRRQPAKPSGSSDYNALKRSRIHCLKTSWQSTRKPLLTCRPETRLQFRFIGPRAQP